MKGAAIDIGSDGISSPWDTTSFAPPRHPIALDPWHGSEVWLRLRQAGVFAVAIGLWQYASGRWVNAFFIGKPSRAFPLAWEWVRDGSINKHVKATLVVSCVGFVIGVIVGVAGGVVLGTNVRVRKAVDPIIKGLYAIPRIAIVPLLVAVFGFSSLPKMIIATFASTFIMLRYTLAGFRDISPGHVAQAAVMGASGLQRIRYVELPHLAPSILVGIELAFPYAVHGAILGEYIGSREGLGYILHTELGLYHVNGIFAALIIIIVFTVVVLAFMKTLIRQTPLRYMTLGIK